MIKILAIDDQKDNLISLTAIIRDAFPDSTIYTAPDGMTGIDLAISKDPDVIILDIIMPGMDGFEVCRRLKSDDRASNIPVVFLTALGGDRKIRIKAFDAGAEAFLSKPIDETELKAQIRAMCIIKTHYQLKKNEKEYLTAQIAARTAQLQKELCEKEWIEKALRESEYFFKESQRAAFIGSYKFDLRSDYWTSSDILKQIFGIDQNYGTSLVGWLDITHPDDREMMAKYFAEEVVGKRKPFNKEYRIIRKSDGETRWVLGLGSLNFDSDNNVTEMLGTIQDITERKLADERLRESNELNDTLLHTIPFGMDIVDTDGNVLFINDNLKQMVDKDFVGKKCWNLYKDDETQCGGCPLIKGVDLGETSSYETSRVLGGKTFQISHTGMMFQGRKAMLEIFQDITERKEVEKRIKLLAHSMESISECVSVTDNNDKIIYVNKSFLHTYGYTLEELIGQHTSILRSPDIRQEHVRDILPETIEGGWRGEIMNRKKDGTLFPILLSTSIIKDDEDQAIALIGVAIDITDMRKSRDELLAAKELAEENNSLKTAFLNNMSHEIRTPMNHIMGFSSLMKEAHADEKDAYADIILKSSNQLLTLIEDVIL